MSYGERSYHIKQFLVYTLNLFISSFIYFFFQLSERTFLKKCYQICGAAFILVWHTRQFACICLEIFPSCFENDVYNFIDFLRSGLMS